MFGDKRGVEGEIHILVFGQPVEGDGVFRGTRDFTRPGVGHDVTGLGRFDGRPWRGQFADAAGQVPGLQRSVLFTEDDGFDQFELRLAHLQQRRMQRFAADDFTVRAFAEQVVRQLQRAAFQGFQVPAVHRDEEILLGFDLFPGWKIPIQLRGVAAGIRAGAGPDEVDGHALLHDRIERNPHARVRQVRINRAVLFIFGLGRGQVFRFADEGDKLPL